MGMGCLCVSVTVIWAFGHVPGGDWQEKYVICVYCIFTLFFLNLMIDMIEFIVHMSMISSLGECENQYLLSFLFYQPSNYVLYVFFWCHRSIFRTGLIDYMLRVASQCTISKIKYFTVGSNFNYFLDNLIIINYNCSNLLLWLATPTSAGTRLPVAE